MYTFLNGLLVAYEDDAEDGDDGEDDDDVKAMLETRAFWPLSSFSI